MQPMCSSVAQVLWHMLETHSLALGVPSLGSCKLEDLLPFGFPGPATAEFLQDYQTKFYVGCLVTSCDELVDGLLWAGGGHNARISSRQEMP